MAIFDHHHPLLLTFGVLGNIVSIFVYFAPLPTFIQIYQRKSTLGFQSLPYVVALFSAMLWMYYAFLKPDAILLISINFFGCVVETIYIILYLAYASKEARKHTGKLIGSLNGGLFCLILVVTLFLLEGLNRVQVVGWVCVAVSVSVFAAPLSVVFQVVRTRSVEFMPFTLSFFLTLSAVMWLAYGLLLKDLCVAVPNVFGFFLGVLQMLLYGIYRNTEKMKVIDQKKLPAEHIINIVMLGTPEVHPHPHPHQEDGNGDAQIKSSTDMNINIDSIRDEGDGDGDGDGGHDKDENKNKAEQIEDQPPAATACCSQVNVQLDSPVLVMCAAA